MTITERYQEIIKELLVSWEAVTCFYGEFSLFIHIQELEAPENLTSMKLTKSGITFYVDKDTPEEISDKTLAYLLIHNILHIIFKHNRRAIEWSMQEPYRSMAMDIIVNEEIANIPSKSIKMPEDVIRLPKEFADENLVFEHIYRLLVEEFPELGMPKEDEDAEKQKNKKGKGQGQGKGKSSGQSSDEDSDEDEDGVGQDGDEDGDSDSGEDGDDIDSGSSSGEKGKNKKSPPTGKRYDTHSDSSSDDLDDGTDDILKNIIDSATHTTSKKKRSNTGALDNLIEKINYQPRERWVSPFSTQIRSFLGAKEPSWRKPNRRGHDFQKGKIKISKEVNIIVDTSGSMFTPSELESVYNAFNFNDSIVNIIQCDTDVKGYDTIKGRDLNKVVFKGGGGTTIQPAFDLLIEKRKNDVPTVLLTDGYTDELDLSRFKHITIVTNAVEAPIRNQPDMLKVYNVKK